MKIGLGLCLFCLAAAPLFATDSSGLHDTVVLIIRHAEKPATGDFLTPAGQQRAQAYVHYFQNYTIDRQPIKIDELIAAADSAGSRRPRLTLTPFSKATGLPIEQPFGAKQFRELANALRARPHGKHLLICWHHGEIPQLIAALGARPNDLLPHGKWPEEIFGWVIQLQYDANGKLVDAERIKENLMPDDAGMLYDPIQPMPPKAPLQ